MRNFVVALKPQFQRMSASSYEQFLKMFRENDSTTWVVGWIGEYATLQMFSHLLRPLERDPTNTILIRLMYAKACLTFQIYQWNTY